jgi:hypothetical protein
MNREERLAMFAFFNIGLQELVILGVLGLGGVVVAGIIIFLNTRGKDEEK